MLAQSRLLANLQMFSDAASSGFGGFPATRVQARQDWAHAFADYLSAIEEDIPRPPPPPGAHPSLDLGGVEAAFFANLALAETLSVDAAAADFAGAWRQAIRAILATPTGATDNASALYKFVQFTNVSVLHDTLRERLKALFQVPAVSAGARLADIASAFHDATRGLSALMNVTVGGSTSGAPVAMR